MSSENFWGQTQKLNTTKTCDLAKNYTSIWQQTITPNNSVTAPVSADPIDIQNFIYMFRGQQVMLDSDLAMLYQVETKYLNRTVKRNIDRFPEDFCFQLSAEEFENLKCQIGTSSLDEGNGYGGRRTRPYDFTEQGISILSGVLHSDVAVAVSIKIMRAFVETRHFIASNALMFERISAMELRQLEFQKETNEKFDQVFEYMLCCLIHAVSKSAAVDRCFDSSW